MAGDSPTSVPGQRDADRGDLRPDELFAGHRIEHEAGRGATGVVYAAFHLRLRVTRALKVLDPKAAGDRVFRARFERESQLAAGLEHPNIVPVYEAGEHDGALYLSMRFVDGPNLSQLLSSEGPLAPERVVALVRQLAAALDVAHERGLVHRDVKPANVLLEGDGDSERAFLVDFGISRLVTGAKDLTQTGEMVGTVNYVAPEQIAGDTVDSRADVYSLACVAYEALTGAPPFQRQTQLATMFAHANDPRPKPSKAGAELPTEVDGVFARALAIDSDARHGRASDFAEDLERALAGERRKKQPGAPRHRRRAAALIAAAIAAIVVVLALTGVFGGSGTESSVSPPTATVSAPPARATASIPVGSHPIAVAVGQFNVWTASADTGTISAIVPADSDHARPPLSIDAAPASLVAAFGSVWVVDQRGGALLRVTPGQGTIQIPVGTQPSDVAASSNALWIANQGDDTVSRVDPSTNQVDATVRAGAAPSSVAVGEGGVWVADAGSGRVTELDSSSAELRGEPVAVGGTPVSIAAGEAGVWVVDRSGAQVRRIAPGSREVSKPILAGADPTSVTTGFGYAWVAAADGEVRRIDPTSFEPAGDPISVGREPVAITAGDGFVWTADRGDSTVTRISPTGTSD